MVFRPSSFSIRVLLRPGDPGSRSYASLHRLARRRASVLLLLITAARVSTSGCSSFTSSLGSSASFSTSAATASAAAATAHTADANAAAHLTAHTAAANAAAHLTAAHLTAIFPGFPEEISIKFSITKTKMLILITGTGTGTVHRYGTSPSIGAIPVQLSSRAQVANYCICMNGSKLLVHVLNWRNFCETFSGTGIIEMKNV
jgi:hypothetical protein